MSNRHSKLLLIIITIFCVFFMAITYIDSTVLEPVRTYTNYLLVPIQKGINSLGTSIAAGISENLHLHEVYDENERLRLRIDELTAENSRLRSETLELERLRELYELDQTYGEYPAVAARVISRDSQKYFNVFRVDKGLADGITKDMNVIGGGGLIGIVVEAGANYATVRTIIDDESNVYAMSQYSSDTCLVKGSIESYDTGKIIISNIDKNAVFNDGDAVITSNLSTKYLPGILIGYASDISINSQHLTKSGLLIPAADFSDIQEVLIITKLKTETGIIDAQDAAG